MQVDLHSDTNRRSTSGFQRQALGCLLAPVLLVAIPVAWWIAPIPLALTPYARVSFVMVALVACALAAASTAGVIERKRFVVTIVSLAVLFSPMIGLIIAGERVVPFFTSETYGRVRSPRGDLVLVHEYVDQGALGGFSNIYVDGRLIPCLLYWHYPIDGGDWPSTLEWVDSMTVETYGRRHEIPPIIGATSW